MRFLKALALSVSLSCSAFAAETKTDTVVLVTIDGMRWQEVFRGVDNAFFDQDATSPTRNTTLISKPNTGATRLRSAVQY
ncbi:hypothetical protein [Kordiimonas gwangyangensis]|uniref:hypothetical protein n=1 Tax=Kordiimonas gwangyangensis TaxID=288022 RepID=UPI0006885672|nr:hypothetical protein [Kordiimonas gwangyangensis]